MLKLAQPRARGFSLVELLVVVAVLGLVLMLGLPNIAIWLQNTQIRSSAEATISGLQLARAEALRRNRNVRFCLVDSLDAGCSLATAGGNWIVSLADPDGNCGMDPSDTVDPFIVQKRSNQDGAPDVALVASASSVNFNGLGSASSINPAVAGGVWQINFSHPAGGACQTAAGPMRCLRVVVNSSGSVRMCDPAVSDATDPRAC
jgi:type IV fimbrial biogenesis protein FimT